MRLLVFIAFMLVAAMTMAVWSYLSGAGIGIIALRTIAVVVALQAVYFFLLMVTSLLSPPPPKAVQPDRDPITKTQEQ